MTTIELNEFTEQIVRNAGFGLSVLAIVLVINAFLFIQIFLWFMRASQKFVKANPYALTFLFVASVLLMSVVQIISILIWTVALYATGLIENLRLAMLFSGSSFTTLGIFSDVLPQGWKSVAFYIAFSGLFSFAIATSSMISMLTIIAKRHYRPVA